MTEVLKKCKKKVVPWFSMAEWQEVYGQIYSGDVTAQQKGYEKILVWKARCATLPAGIECTLSLIHVSLQDQEIWPQIIDGLLPPYKEHDLRLMYSTAIMRFLNHISMVAQDEYETLYRMAKRVHIPDWVVNIRHDLAHGHNLPSLNVLRSATHFSLDWIHEHYWKGESKLATDYFACEKPICDDDQVKEYFQEYIELWQALKLYILQGYTNMKDIPDSDFLSRVNEVIDRLPTKRKKQLTDSDADASNLNDTAITKDIRNCQVKSILNQLLTHLDVFLARNKKFLLEDDLLVTTLLDGETFIPNEELLLTLIGENASKKGPLPSRLRDIWQNIMTVLPQAIFPVLLQKLIQLVNRKEETTHRRKMAANWLKEICLSLIKANWIQNTVKRIENDMLNNMPVEINSKEKSMKFKDKKVSTSIERKVVKEVDNLRPEVKDVLTLNAVDLPNSMDLLKLILLSPNRWTKTFLPSFLDLVEPALSSTVKMNLIELVQTYTCSTAESKIKEVEQPKFNIYTLNMLTNIAEKPTDIRPSEMEVDNEPTILQDGVDVDQQEGQQDNIEHDSTKQQSLSWAPSETYYEWENCPLGILPWQKTESLASITFVCDSIWKTTLPTNTPRVSYVAPPAHVHDTIDWDNIQPKKKSLKKFKRRSVHIKKACELTKKQ